jgi:hypothetical protein
MAGQDTANDFDFGVDYTSDEVGLVTALDPSDPSQNITYVSLPVCNVTLTRDLQVTQAFEYTHRIEQAHNMAIRFGKTSDMMSLLSGSDDEQADYMSGGCSHRVFLWQSFFWFVALSFVAFGAVVVMNLLVFCVGDL